MAAPSAGPSVPVMPATIIVGVDDSPRSEDAIALARALADAAGAEVLAVCAFPYDDRPEAHFNLALRPALQELADKTLEKLCEPLTDDARVRRLAVADLSPARALERVAREEHAALIVVGSSHAGRHARLHPGSTAERLLQGAPCPVALAPLGYRLRPHLELQRISVAYDASPEGARALSAGLLVARAAGAPLRVIRVFTPDWPVPPSMLAVPGYIRLTPAAEEAAHAELDRTVAALPGDVWAEPAFLHGDPAHQLTVESEVADLLVIGSRGYGPLKSVLLGGVSGKVVRTAACPVLIVPHGADASLDALFSGALRENTDTDGGVSRTEGNSAGVPLSA
jgi:nucleotide-binding universal stress UspA family protein